MPLFSLRLVLAASVLLGPLSRASAQSVTPRIGYVYPAGGRQGTTFQTAVGGQRLDGVTNVSFSGSGIQGVVIEFNKPMPRKEFTLLRDKLIELRDRKRALMDRTRQDGLTNSAAASTNQWTPADDKTIAEIREKLLKNPPNRQGNPAIAETATVQVTVAPDAEPGERELRLVTANGLSNPIGFYVGQLPEYTPLAAKAPNPEFDRLRQQLGGLPQSAPAKSETRLTLPTVVNGQIMPGEVDRFRFTALQGQRLVLMARARALIPYLPDAVPGWFQATLVLYDSKGKELQYADSYRFNPDPVLFCEIPRTGDYVIEIKDAIYRGREDFVYRLSVGELPFVTSLFPLGAQSGRPTTVELRGWNLAESGLTPDTDVPGIRWLSAHKDKLVSNVMPFAVDALAECREQEPNNQTNQAQAVTLPMIVNGRIDPPGDWDVFRFEGRAGSELVAEVQARRLNSPLDSVLRLTDAAGTVVALNDDGEDKSDGLATHHADSMIRISLPQTGTYYLYLGDTQQKGGPEYAYRLRLSPPQPDFALRVVPSSLTVRPGATIPFTVYALRKDGFSNEIALAFKDAPRGFALSGALVPANQDRVRLTLTAPNTNGFEPVRLQLEGRAVIQQRTVVHAAVPAEDMMQAFAYRHLVPAKEFQVAVMGRWMQRAAVKIVSDVPVRIPLGRTASVRLSTPARAWGDRFHLDLSEPPEGISIASADASSGGTELVLQSDPAKTKPGLKGNLIVNAYAGPQDSSNIRPRGMGRSPLATLPAIPFEIE